MIDLPLGGETAEADSTHPEPEPPQVHRAPPPKSKIGPWLFGVFALAAGALAGWFLKPDPAVFVLSTALLDFGEVRVETASEALRVEISNAGERGLPLTRVSLEGDAPADFTLVDDACSGRELAARGVCGMEVLFKPAATGFRRAWLLLEGEALNRASRIPLLGFGVAPQLEAEPLKIDFGEHLVGNSSTSSTLRVANRGSAPLTIRSVELEGAGAGEFVVRDLCSGKSLATGERCTLVVEFRPTLAGDRRATVRLKSDAGDELAAFPELLGRGLARRAALALQPRRLAFEPQPLETTSAPKRVTLSNEGTAPLVLGQIVLRADSSEAALQPGFELRAEGCRERTLAAGQSCTLEVLFEPPDEGELTAVLEIYQDESAPRRVPLSGTGTVPKIFLDPLVVDFGRVPAGELSDSRFVRIVNSGTGPLEVTEVRLRGSGAQAFTARPVGCTTAPIQPKSSCGVEVRFKPHRGGAFEAEVTLGHNAREKTSLIRLRGLGQIR